MNCCGAIVEFVALYRINYVEFYKQAFWKQVGKGCEKHTADSGEDQS
jgi:hypothetical protein